MSGILALLQTGALASGAVSGPGLFPARDLLERLTASMAYRGPEGLGTWCGGPVGMGHALLRTHTPGEQEEPGVVHDPASGLSVVADARLDGREELVRELVAAGAGGASGDGRPPPTPLSPAPELILAAYRAWGEECPEHLLGDYGFLVWDAPRRTLFAARDPFGVKPLFVAEVGGDGGWVVLSNTLPAVLEHPEVSWEPDELAMGDFLLFGSIHDEEMTHFRAIRQVPRGTTLTYAPQDKRTGTFWSLPDPGELRYRRWGEYVEQFETLFHQAVADRLPAPDHAAVIELSGGLDSGSIACAAVEVRGGRAVGDGPFPPGKAPALHAYTMGYERLFEDPEWTLSRVTAEALGLPHTLVPADDLPVLPAAHTDRDSGIPPGPGHGEGDETAARFAELGRVSLAGWDGDALLYGDAMGRLWGSLRGVRLPSLLADFGAMARAGIMLRRIPRVGLRTNVRNALRPPPDLGEGYLKWIRPEFAQRWGLRERWEGAGGKEQANPSDFRRQARATLWGPVWSSLFLSQDPGQTRLSVEHRHPLMDLRLVRFFLALPVIPWCVEKFILRAYLAGRLPAAIWRRKKQGLQGDPLALAYQENPGVFPAEKLRISGDSRLRDVLSLEGDFSHLLPTGEIDLYLAVRVSTLSQWIHRLASAPIGAGESHESVHT